MTCLLTSNNIVVWQQLQETEWHIKCNQLLLMQYNQNKTVNQLNPTINQCVNWISVRILQSIEN